MVFGPVILSKDKSIISVGRTKPPTHCNNQHIQMNNLDELEKLDNLNFDKVIFFNWEALIIMILT